jgi:2-dehydropantoate 2-reductase
LQGTVLSLAERAGTPAPLLKRVTALVRQAEREKRGSPGLTPEAVAG